VGSYAIILVTDKGLIGFEGGQVLGVIAFRLGLVEVEFKLVGQLLVDLRGIGLGDIT
jgi:hypothetical protein